MRRASEKVASAHKPKLSVSKLTVTRTILVPSDSEDAAEMSTEDARGAVDEGRAADSGSATDEWVMLFSWPVPPAEAIAPAWPPRPAAHPEYPGLRNCTHWPRSRGLSRRRPGVRRLRPSH